MQGQQGNQNLDSVPPMLHLLPDGQIAYVQMTGSPHTTSTFMYPSDSFDRQKAAQRRNRWGRVVAVTGVLILFVAWVVLATRVLSLQKTIRKRRWFLWSIGLSIAVMLTVIGVLAIRAGVKKTSASVNCYLRVLVLVSMLLVVALVLATMLTMEKQEHKWQRYRHSLKMLSETSSAVAAEAEKSNKDEKKTTEKDDKDDKDEAAYWKERAKGEALIMGMFLLILVVIVVLMVCVLCAIKLLVSARQYEQLVALYGERDGVPYVPITAVQGVSAVQMRVHYPQVS